MQNEIETFEHAGLKVTLGWEEDCEPFNPRDAECNLGTMVCWHPSYVLGDEQLRGDGRGAVETVFETEHGRTDFRSMETIERYLRLARGAVCILPLYLLDHSGLAMSAGSNFVGRGDTACGGRDSWGNARGWDTTMVGFIYTSAERIRELCGEPQIESDPFYCPRTWPEDGRSGPNWPRERTALEWIEQNLREEVQVYDDWLQGQVYWYTVESAEGDVDESCGGFLGGGIDADGKRLDGLDYCRQEAREAAESAAQARREAAERERAEASYWALRDVATVGA